MSSARPASSASPDPTATGAPRAARLGLAMVALLLLQVVVGTANALWLSVPTSGNAWATSAPLILLNAHLLLGTLITVVAVWLLVDAFRARRRDHIVAGVVGLVGVVAAIGGGSAFLSTNGDAVSSFLMAIGCVVAIGAYLAPLVRR